MNKYLISTSWIRLTLIPTLLPFKRRHKVKLILNDSRVRFRHHLSLSASLVSILQLLQNPIPVPQNWERCGWILYVFVEASQTSGNSEESHLSPESNFKWLVSFMFRCHMTPPPSAQLVLDVHQTGVGLCPLGCKYKMYIGLLQKYCWRCSIHLLFQ